MSTRIALLAAFAALIVTTNASAQSLSSTQSRTDVAELNNGTETPRVLVVPVEGLQADLALKMGHLTVLQFTEPIKRGSGKPRGVHIEVLKQEKRVDVWPTDESIGGNFVIQFKGRPVTFQVRRARSDEPVKLIYRISSWPAETEVPKHQLEVVHDELAKSRTECTRARQSETEARQQARDARRHASMVRATARAAEQKARSAEARAGNAEARASNAEARARAAETRARGAEAAAARARARERAAIDQAKNRTEHTVHQMLVTAAKDLVYDQPQKLAAQGSKNTVTSGRAAMRFRHADWKEDYLLLDATIDVSPGRVLHIARVGVVTPGGKELNTRLVMPSAAEDPARGILLSITPGAPETVVVAVKMPADVAAEGLRLNLFEYASSRPPLTFQIPRYGRLVAISNEEEQRIRWAKQLVIGPRVSVGGCWLASGLAGDDSLESTSCTAVGAYVSKGYNDLVAIGVDALGSWSGDAQFARDPSDVMRSAKFFRLMLLGDLRLSRGNIVPYARVGGGLQAMRYDDGSDAATEIAVTYMLGGGLTYRVGENVSTGLTAQLTETTDRMFRSLEAGIHLSYGWTL